MYGRLCPSCDSQAQVQILLLLQPLVSRPCIEGYGAQQLVHTDSSYGANAFKIRTTPTDEKLTEHQH